MKKHEITTIELEQLFNTLLEEKPLIEEEQVTALLFTLPERTNNNRSNHTFKSYLNILLIGVFVLLIVAGLFLWYHSGDTMNEAILTKNQPTENTLAATPVDSVEMKTIAEVVYDSLIDTIKRKPTLERTFVAANKNDSIVKVEDIYNHFDKKPQRYTIRGNRDTTLICKEGTSIKIKANSFVSEKTGEVISTEIQLAVKEYYQLSDIILSNLSTTSGNRILETGGMLHVNATADNEKCLVNEGATIEIGFPYSAKKEDMKLFNGVWATDKIDWELTPVTQETIRVNEVAITETVVEELQDEVFIIAEEPACFIEGSEFPGNYFDDIFKYPFSAIKNKMEGPVYVSFIINKTGHVENIRIIRSLDNILDKAAIYLVNNLPECRPAKQGGRPVNQSFVWRINFSLKDTPFTEEEIMQSKLLEEKIKDIKYDIEKGRYTTTSDSWKEIEGKIEIPNSMKATVSEVNRYFFSTSQLGWINCDRFVNSRIRMTNYAIKVEQPGKTIVKVIFNQYRSILPGNNEPNRVTFSNVPLGAEITIVAFNTDGQDIFMAVKESTITDKEEVLTNFKPVSLSLLKKEMEKLNR
jgi:TonB family protein